MQVQDLNGVGITKDLALATFIGLCSAALGKPVLSGLAVLGNFSIGGTIAWKACLSGLEAHRIVALSSTRLRYETVLPATGIYLYYGETDPYKPDEVWMRQMNLSCRIFPETGHLLYRESNFASQVCRDILNGV